MFTSRSRWELTEMQSMFAGSIVIMALVLAGCSRPKGDKGDKGDTGKGEPGSRGAQGDPGPPGKDGRDGSTPPPQFMALRPPPGEPTAIAMCASDELVVSAICIAKLGTTSEAPTTIGDSGASCPTQNQPAQAVLLCAKR
jgi:hypothetical protein